MSSRDRKPQQAQPALNAGPGKPPAFYSVADLAARWGMSQRHVRRLIDEGHLVSHRFGTAVRISYANVLIYEAACISVT